MAATASIDAIEWLRKQIEETAPDPLKTMLTTMVGALMSAEIDAACGAGYRERNEERENSRNGYRGRPWDTRVGTIDLQIPKLRHGTYFPGWLLEPRRRAEKALTAVVAEATCSASPRGGSRTWSQALGIEKLSKSKVSELAKVLDADVKSFRERPLAVSYKYVWLDALMIKCREGGRIVNVACLVAVGVNDDGRREILGLDVVTTEDGAGWLAFLRDLRARGMKSVELVISDAHPGLKDAIASVLRGATWQRCRTHFIRNLLTRVPKAAHPIVATYVRTIFAQPDAESVREQLARTRGAPPEPLPEGRHDAGGRPRRTPRLHRVPEGALAPDLVEQPPGAAQPRDPPPHRRRRHLPQPRRHHPPRRRRARRTPRRMGRRPPLHDHQPRGTRGGTEGAEADAQEARRVVSQTG